jgi:epoxyqueuosine reductase
MSLEESIRNQAWELGFDACRFTGIEPPESAPRFQHWLEQGYQGDMAWLGRSAPRRINPQLVLPGARSVVMLSASYRDPGPVGPWSLNDAGSSAGGGAYVAAYARHADYHEVLMTELNHLVAFMNGLGGPGSRSLAYTDTGPILERDLAQRAGVGFVGKHTNLISRTHGNWILLAEILTTLELQPDAEERNRCGSCVRCIKACPTQAITAPFQLDARLCISYLTIEHKGPIPERLRPAIGQRIFGCDDCLAVCPWNRFAHEGFMLRQHFREDLQAPNLLELLALDEPGFQRRFAGTPVERTGRKRLLRNVCLALGNAGDPGVLPALEQAARHPDPLIAEHARWGCGQLLAI